MKTKADLINEVLESMTPICQQLQNGREKGKIAKDLHKAMTKEDSAVKEIVDVCSRRALK